MEYPDIQDAARRLAIPMERWLYVSGKEVLSDDVGMFKVASWDGRVNYETGEIIETGLTYWAAHTHQGLNFGMAASKESAVEAARTTIMAAYRISRSKKISWP